jgi:hypothetical protein
MGAGEGRNALSPFRASEGWAETQALGLVVARGLLAWTLPRAPKAADTSGAGSYAGF